MVEAATEASEADSHRRHGQAMVGFLLNHLGGPFLHAKLPGTALSSVAPLLCAPHRQTIQAGLQLLLSVVQETPQVAADALPELEDLLPTVWGLMPHVGDHAAVRHRCLRSISPSPCFGLEAGPAHASAEPL